MAQADVGLIGLAVMGENLILNMESKGFTVACFNRTVSKVDDFINGRAKGKNIIGCHSIEEFVGVLKKPRKIMLMVKAGPPVDEFINHLLPLLENGDILIDGGVSMIIFFINLVYSAVRGPVAEANPWRSRSPEWQLPTPIPVHNYGDEPFTVVGEPYDYGLAGSVYVKLGGAPVPEKPMPPFQIVP